MWSRAQSTRSLALAASIASLTACASDPPARAPTGDGGWVDRSTPAPSPGPARPAVASRWDLAAQLAAARPAVARVRSSHLTGELEAEVLASSAGTYPRLGPSSRLPVGATLIERLLAPGSSEPAAYFAMVKRAPGYDAAGGDWEYLVVSPSGQIEQRGALPLCARCHAEAPHDHLFGRGR